MSSVPANIDFVVPPAALPSPVDGGDNAARQPPASHGPDAVLHYTQCELMHRLVASPDLPAAAAVLADGLQRAIGCDRVAVTFNRGRPGAGPLRALSGTGRFDRRGELVRRVESAARDAVSRGQIIVWTADRPSAPTHQHLAAAAADAECVVSLPLPAGEAGPVGACVAWGSRETLANGHLLARLQALTAAAAPCLELVARARSGPAGFLLRWLRGTTARRQKQWLVAVVLIAALLLAVPWPHRVACDCQIEPVTRRFLSAPYDGILERVLVKAGDSVSPGQVLARMDGREIRWELASLYADRAAAMKRRDAAMATHDAGKVQFAKLDLQRLDLKIRLLEERAEHLELKSPISGLVVRGDLEKVEGAPLTVGQTLFEIAPLDQMTVELAVPEENVSYVRPELPVRFSLDAYPGRRWEGTLGDVHPRAEQREHRQVFVAEFNMPNPNQQWKPGMSGRAAITGPWRPAGWILFHKAWERAAMKLGW